MKQIRVGDRFRLLGVDERLSVLEEVQQIIMKKKAHPDVMDEVMKILQRPL